MRVFIVEDSAAVCERLVEMIGGIEGAAVAGVAGDERGAVEDMLDTRPDVAIVDIKLGEGSGFEVLRMVRRQLPGLIMIVLSNYGAPQYRKASLDAGADYFFDKVRDLEKLTMVLHELRDSSRRGTLH